MTKDDPSSDQLNMIFVRHGLSYNNYLKATSLMMCLQRCPFGWTFYEKHCDAPLTLPGRKQARSVGKILARERNLYRGAVFCSQMERTVETAMELNAGAREVDSSFGNSVVPVPFFQEVSRNLCVSTPTEQRFRSHANRTRTKLVDRFRAPDWIKSKESSGFYQVNPLFESHTLPLLKRMVGNKTAVVVGHGQHIRRMLNLGDRLKNSEGVRVTYNLSSQKVERIERVDWSPRMEHTPRSEVLARDSSRERIENLYIDTCRSDLSYSYPVFE